MDKDMMRAVADDEPGDFVITIQGNPPDYKQIAKITKQGVVTIDWDEAEKTAKSEPSDSVVWGLATLMLHIRGTAASSKTETSELAIAVARDRIAELINERDAFRAALEAIKQATLEGRVCDDVAWFDEVTTLHDFCDAALQPDGDRK
jgi:hypothetical protein